MILTHTHTYTHGYTQEESSVYHAESFEKLQMSTDNHCCLSHTHTHMHTHTHTRRKDRQCWMWSRWRNCKCPPTNTAVSHTHICIYINIRIHAGGIVSVRRGVVGGIAGAESVHRQPLLWLHGWQRLFVSGCYCLKAATCCNTLRHTAPHCNTATRLGIDTTANNGLSYRAGCFCLNAAASCNMLHHTATQCNTVGLEELPAMDFLLRCYSSENIASAAEVLGGGGQEEERAVKVGRRVYVHTQYVFVAHMLHTTAHTFVHTHCTLVHTHCKHIAHTHCILYARIRAHTLCIHAYTGTHTLTQSVLLQHSS